MIASEFTAGDSHRNKSKASRILRKEEGRIGRPGIRPYIERKTLGPIDRLRKNKDYMHCAASYPCISPVSGVLNTVIAGDTPWVQAAMTCVVYDEISSTGPYQFSVQCFESHDGTKE